MKAIVHDAFGDADVLRLGDFPMPVPRSSDLLVKVKALGVNRSDIYQRQGFYGTKGFGDSVLLGLEVAGEVVSVGEDVSGFEPGDRVMAIVGGGSYAEYARVDSGLATRIPPNLGYVEAAAVMESFVTAWEAIVHLGGIEHSGTVLVHAAAGGIGTAAVQVANALGATVFATASAARRADIEALGAGVVFDYRSEDFAVGVHQLTEGHGCDVIVDFVGGDYFVPNLNSLRPGGRLIQVGLLGDQGDTRIPLGLVLENHLRIIGTVMKSRHIIEKRAMVRRFVESGLPYIRDGQMRAVVSQTFPLAKADEAHRAMEFGGGFGKIVLTVDN